MSPFTSIARPQTVFSLLVIFVVVAFICQLTIGPYYVKFQTVVMIMIDSLPFAEVEQVGDIERAIVIDIRMPRTILGAAVGAALAIAGAMMQALFRNSLADPGLLGVSAGGALAAITVIVLGGNLMILGSIREDLALPISAFIGAFATVFLIYSLSIHNGQVIISHMLLVGVAINALASAGIGYLTYTAADNELRSITFWTMGSLGTAGWHQIGPAMLLIVFSLGASVRLGPSLNCLSLGDAEARSMGVSVERTKFIAASLTAIGVGAATAVCGIVGFIGLVVPHLARLIVGPDNNYVLPASALLGAGVVLMADLAARLFAAPAELPLGVFTSALGAPFFLWLLHRAKRTGVFG